MFDITTIGSATKDVFLLSPDFKILRNDKNLGKKDFPESEAQCFPIGAKIKIERAVFLTGGGSTNAATTFSRQDLETAALVRLGNDENADYILEKIKKEKISPLVIKDKKKGSDYSTILLNSSGERTVLIYYGASSGLSVSEIPFGKMKSKWVYIAPGDIFYGTIEKIFNHFHKSKTLIAFNPSRKFIDLGLKKLKPLLDQTEVLILNLEEGAVLTGIDYKKEKEIFEKLDMVKKRIVVMTNGPKGVVVSDGRNIYRAGVFSGKIVDRLGAGDAFGSGFVAGLIRQIENCKSARPAGGLKIENLPPKAVEYAIRLGSANAASVVGKIGAKEGILTKREFNDKKWGKLKILCHTKK